MFFICWSAEKISLVLSHYVHNAEQSMVTSVWQQKDIRVKQIMLVKHDRVDCNCYSAVQSLQTLLKIEVYRKLICLLGGIHKQKCKIMLF